MTVFGKIVSLAALVAAAVAAEENYDKAYWIFGGVKPLVTTRLDPIMNPNTTGEHVHSVIGASRFSNYYDADDLMKSKCTTIPVQKDLSNYWMPQLYHVDNKTGDYTAIPTIYNVYYQQRPGPKDEKIQAFPKGLRMIAGDNKRGTYDPTSHADQAISYVCQDFEHDHTGDPDWDERHDFFDHNCPTSMRLQVYFPSCWNGRDLDSADHKSHMAYPIQNYNSGDCPETHPVHLVSLFLEMVASVDKFDYWGYGSWSLANGDQHGYRLHADFTNGWDKTLLQSALDQCKGANGDFRACPPLKAATDENAASGCKIETKIPDEDVGLNGPIEQLPGCNPLWDGTGPKPPCPAGSNTTDPQMAAPQSKLPSGWREVGCIADNTNARAMSAAFSQSNNMTRAMCASQCASKGYKLAGLEYGTECYCDNKLQNGASMTTVKSTECDATCAGNVNEDCGGIARLTLLTNGS